MHIISKKKLRGFWEKYPKAKAPLEAWYQVAKHAEWEQFAHVRKSFTAFGKNYPNGVATAP